MGGEGKKFPQFLIVREPTVRVDVRSYIVRTVSSGFANGDVPSLPSVGRHGY